MAAAPTSSRRFARDVYRALINHPVLPVLRMINVYFTRQWTEAFPLAPPDGPAAIINDSLPITLADHPLGKEHPSVPRLDSFALTAFLPRKASVKRHCGEFTGNEMKSGLIE